MFVVDDIIKGIFDMAKTGMELGKPGPAQAPIEYQRERGPLRSFGDLADPTPSEGTSKITEQTKTEMNETPAASVGGAPVNGGAAVSDMIGDIDPTATMNTYPARPLQTPPDPFQRSDPRQMSNDYDMSQVPNDPTLLAKANERQAYEDAQSKMAGGAAMDTALGLGQDIFSMSQQLAKPGPTGSIQMPKGPGQNPRLSALLGQLYRG